MAFISPARTEINANTQTNTLSSLLRHPAVWQAKHAGTSASNTTISSGYDAFDAQLHLGGWPCNSSTELFCDQTGIGEFSVLLPALKSLLQQAQQRRLALIAPPYVPYAPALQHSGIDLRRLIIIQAHKTSDQLWANEQLLRCGHFAAVINWFGLGKSSHTNKNSNRQSYSYAQGYSYAQSYNYAKLRRIQLAAQEGRCWSISFRPYKDSQHASPASLRIKLQTNDQNLLLNIIKQQGGWAGQTIQLPRPNSLLTNSLNINDWIKKERADDNCEQTTHKKYHSTMVGHSFPRPGIRNLHSELRR